MSTVSGDGGGQDGRHPDLMDAPEVAVLLGLDIKTVYAAAGKGQIPCCRAGRRYLFSRTALETWLAGIGTVVSTVTNDDSGQIRGQV